MSTPTESLLFDLVAEARLAPSVHNIQPTRWRLLDSGRLALIDDNSARLPVADPTNHDVWLSHGAALEGMSLALNRRGFSIADIETTRQPLPQQLTTLCTFAINEGAPFDPLTEHVAQRMSWRGRFSVLPGDAVALMQLSEILDGVTCVSDRQTIASIADWSNQAEYSFVRDDGYRKELVDWMRLSPTHPEYLQNGLNRDALSMSAIEATAARFVLRGLFKPLDRIGLAALLLADGTKIRSAAGIIIFCRPVAEAPITTGRHFYRTWLAISRAGFAACPMSALTDHPGFNEQLRKLCKIEPDLRLVNVFRVGRPAEPQQPRHFRLPIDRLIV